MTDFTQLDIEHKRILMLNHLALSIAVNELVDRIGASKELILDEIWEFGMHQLNELNRSELEIAIQDIENQHELAKTVSDLRVGITTIQLE